MSRRRFNTAVFAIFFIYVLTTISAVAHTQTADPEVVFNKQSSIYHRASCSAARRCTKNCITITLSEAKKRGGRACQICGGPATSELAKPEGFAGTPVFTASFD